MPNWCNNVVTLKHDDPQYITRAITAFKAEKFFTEFMPCPPELHEYDAPQRDAVLAEQFLEKYGATDWYDWQVKNWGTKWDVGWADGAELVDINTVVLNFDSPWNAPVTAYYALSELGFSIDAVYYEPGMAFCGEYTTEDGDISYEIEADPEWIMHHIPKKIREAFPIVEDFTQEDEDQYDFDDDEPLLKFKDLD